MRVLAVASEAYPLVKTGGLADVVGALPAALAAEDIEVRTLLPGYPGVLARLEQASDVTPPGLSPGARLLSGIAGTLDVFVLDDAALFGRAGNPYVASDGRDWPDNAQRFAALSRAGAAIGAGGVAGFAPDLLHCHDWQAGLVPAFLAHAATRPTPPPPTVFTVHNLAFGGLFPASLLAAIGLPATAFTIEGVEFHNQISFLKAGLRYAAHVTTVSPTYAEEIRGPDGGMGFDGVLRARGAAVSGILNGIDTDIWDPSRDPLLPASYARDALAGRLVCAAALRARFGLAESAGPLFGVVSRLTTQKGLDLLVEALPTLLEVGGQLALLGAGDAALEAAFAAQAAAFPDRIGVRIGYDESLAHLIQAGCDALLVPSRFEPCGLTQLCALRYGAVPVVARVGGLADTVIDANAMALGAGVATGLQFAPVTVEALDGAIRRAASLFAQPGRFAGLQRNGMSADVSWRGPAKEYADLFRSLIGA